jgi:transposase
MAEGHRVARLDSDNASLRPENTEPRDAICVLTNKIADLESKLGQTSKDSSLPPSRDPNTVRAEAKADRAARRGGSRKQGRRPGAEGRHVARVENPDPPPRLSPGGVRRLRWQPDGGDSGGIGEAPAFDLSPIKVEVTEHVCERVGEQSCPPVAM